MCSISPRCLYKGFVYERNHIETNLERGSPRDSIIPKKTKSIIGRFDVRLETFTIIKVPSRLVPTGYHSMWLAEPRESSLTDKTLINYRGRIGVVENPREGSFRLWVLEDAEKEVWSMNTFALPESAAGLDFKVMETFSTGEVCLVPKELSDPFCIFYYNLEEKSMRSVTIEGLPMSELKKAQTRSFSNSFSVSVSDHYENSMSVVQIKKKRTPCPSKTEVN